MSICRRKFAVRHPVVVDIGCSCRRPKMPSFFSSMPKPKPPKNPSYFSPSTTTTTTTSGSHWETSLTGTTSSPSRCGYASSPAFYPLQSPRRKLKAARVQPRPPTTRKKNSSETTPAAATTTTTKKKKKKKGVVEESVAVVKESSDPYVDFKESMLQMIVEMEIYAWDDLRDLLHRFLALNSPYHHHLILQAFAEIWNALFSSSAAVGDASTSGHRRRR